MTTRKITALMLTLTIIASAFFIGGNAFSAAAASAKKSSPKTYLAAKDVFVSGSSYFYIKLNPEADEAEDWQTNRLYALWQTNSKGNEKMIGYTGCGSGVDPTFFSNGKYVYYTNSYDAVLNIYSLKTQKTSVLKSVRTIIGGYGENAIIIDKKQNICSVSPDGKKTKLLGNTKNSVYLFNGNLFYGTKKYSIANGKVSASAKKLSAYPTDNYLYYLNSKGNLISLDKSGKKQNVDTKVDKIIGANNGKTVLYTKGRTVLRRTGTGKKIKIADVDRLIALCGFDVADIYKSDFFVSQGSVQGDKIVLLLNAPNSVHNCIISMDTKGKKQKLAYSNENVDDDMPLYVVSVKLHNNKLFLRDKGGENNYTVYWQKACSNT